MSCRSGWAGKSCLHVSNFQMIAYRFLASSSLECYNHTMKHMQEWCRAFWWLIIALLLPVALWFLAIRFPNERRTLLTIALATFFTLVVDRCITTLGIFRSAARNGIWGSETGFTKAHKDVHDNFATARNIAIVFIVICIVLVLLLLFFILPV